MPSKAQRIRALKAAGHSNKEIARIIGCREEYVRACQQDRAEIGRRYVASNDTYRRKTRARWSAYGNARTRGLSNESALAIARDVYRLTK